MHCVHRHTRHLESRFTIATCLAYCLGKVLGCALGNTLVLIFADIKVLVLTDAIDNCLGISLGENYLVSVKYSKYIPNSFVINFECSIAT